MRISLTTLFIVTLGVLVPSVSIASVSGPDGTSSHPYEAALSAMKEEGVMQGYPDGQFRPDNVVNRAEFMKIVLSAKGIHPEGQGCFPDVRDQWFAPWVCAATKRGIVSGYPDGFFRPERTISFAEAAKMLAKVSDAPEGEISPWYKGFVDFLGSNNAIPPSISGFDHLVTRGETAAMVWVLRGGNDEALRTLAEQSLQYDLLENYVPNERVFAFEGGRTLVLEGTRLLQLCTPSFADRSAASAAWDGETLQTFYQKYCPEAWALSPSIGMPEYYPYARDEKWYVASNPGGYEAFALMTHAQASDNKASRIQAPTVQDGVTMWTTCVEEPRVLSDGITAIAQTCTSYYRHGDEGPDNWMVPTTHCYVPVDGGYLAYVIPLSAMDSGADGCRTLKTWGLRSVRVE